MVFGLNLIEINSIVRKRPIYLRGFKKLVENGIDGFFAGHAVWDELIFKSPDFGDKSENLLFPFPFDFSFSLHIFIIESKISSRSANYLIFILIFIKYQLSSIIDLFI